MKTVCCWMRRKDACWHIGYWISTYEGSRNGKSVWRYVGGDSGRGVIPLDWIRHRARAASYETTVDDRVSIAVTGRYSAHHLTLTFTTSFPPNFLWKHSCKVDVWAWTKDIVIPSSFSSPRLAARGLKYAGLSRWQLGQCQERRCFANSAKSLRDIRDDACLVIGKLLPFVYKRKVCFHKH